MKYRLFVIQTGGDFSVNVPNGFIQMEQTNGKNTELVQHLAPGDEVKRDRMEMSSNRQGEKCFLFSQAALRMDLKTFFSILLFTHACLDLFF